MQNVKMKVQENKQEMKDILESCRKEDCINMKRFSLSLSLKEIKVIQIRECRA